MPGERLSPVGLFKRWVVGRPMPLAQARHERLSKTVALAVFSSDALSSVAYATEEILLVLVLAGPTVAHLTNPISFAIVGLLAIVAISYQQTIHAYPGGGGSYIVARANLGPTAGLVAAAALLIDYVLTVAVSVAAGVAAITSAVPGLLTHRVALGVFFVALIAFANLRGVRESGRVFAVPTYLFIATFAFLVGWGLFRWIRGELPVLPDGVPAATTELTGFLVLRAFSSGCTALTGVEAISNGVPAFQPPEAKNASITLGWMAVILGTLFAGITLLANAIGVTPVEDQTVVSQIARALFGQSFLYYLVQASTTMILVLAANTSFADFPRLSSLLARDRYAPRQFRTLGDRLVFSNGVVILAALAALLIVLFRGRTHALIPLYAVGVFLSFTLSQSGMVRHWLMLKGPGWRRRLAINGIGAVITAVVTVIIAMTKFVHGAWIVVLLIPLMVLAFRAVHQHYERVATELSLVHLDPSESALTNTVLVLVGDLHMGVVRALRYAKSLSPNPKAVYVELDPAFTPRLEERWAKGGGGVPLVVLASPYRSVLGPLLAYIDRIRRQTPDGVVTVVIPEFVARRWWQHLLHNQTALMVKGALLFKRNVVVVDVPFHLAS